MKKTILFTLFVVALFVGLSAFTEPLPSQIMVCKLTNVTDRDSIHNYYIVAENRSVNMVWDCDSNCISSVAVFESAIAQKIDRGEYIPPYTIIEYCPPPFIED